MIRINLLGEKPDLSGRYLVQSVIAVGVLIVTFATCFVVHEGVASELEAKKQEKTHLEQSLAKLKEVTKKVQGLEEKRKFLQEKLNTIAMLKAKKHGPVHILDDVNLAVPEKTWLTTVSQKGTTLSISGIALDNQTIALFMHNLNKSSYISSVDLVHATQHVKEKVKLKEFLVSAELKDALNVKHEPAADATAKSEKKVGS